MNLMCYEIKNEFLSQRIKIIMQIIISYTKSIKKFLGY